MVGTEAIATTAPIGPAFADPVFDAARTYRAILTAMSRPGTIVTVETSLEAPAPIGHGMGRAMGRAMAATLMTLCDVDTPVHLDAMLGTDVCAWSDFHTGAPRVSEAGRARFVFVSAREGCPPLSAFAQGTQAYPDRSATGIIACERLSDGGSHRLTGPGIETRASLACDVFDAAFLHAWAENGRRFPRGVDLILTCGDRLAALPRTTRIEEAR